jgi:hypothetical protein
MDNENALLPRLLRWLAVSGAYLAFSLGYPVDLPEVR